MALHRRLQWNLWFWRRNCGKACAKCASLGSHRAYHLSSNASQEQEPQASLLFDSLGTPCNFDLQPCQYIRSLCISPLFPHTHTHALFPIFFFFSISKRSLTVCAMMPWASFSRVRHMCIVCVYFHWSLEESNFVDGSQLFKISNTVPYVSVLVHVRCMVVNFRPKCHLLGPWIIFLWMSWLSCRFFVVAVVVIFCTVSLFSACNWFSVL